MLEFRKLVAPQKKSFSCLRFSGLGRGEGQWEAMENFTSDGFPHFSTRKGRSIEAVFTAPGGMIPRETLCYVDNHRLYAGGLEIEGLTLSGGEKQLVSMGSKILIWPDKKWYCTQSGSYGALENITVTATVMAALCDGEGTPLENIFRGEYPPEEPVSGQLWMDGEGMCRFDGRRERWEEVQTYIKLSGANLGKGFTPGDGVFLAGADALDGLHILKDQGDGFILFSGIISGNFQFTNVTVTRSVPDMDFVTEWGGRLWGCKYGLVNGKAVNAIYASAPGDPRNWYRDDGFCTQRSSDGPFTGVASLDGKILFFKEGCLEKVYPSDSGNHQITVMPCRGVKKGAHKSLAVVGDNLYYQSSGGVCRYDGSLPQLISQELDFFQGTGVAGSLFEKYYLSLSDGLYVYDTLRKLWHRENPLNAQCFAAADGKLYAIDGDNRLVNLSEGDEEIFYFAQTPLLGLDRPGGKVLRSLRLVLKARGQGRVLLRYDTDTEFREIAQFQGDGQQQVLSVLLQGRVCEAAAFRIEGTGSLCLYSMTKEEEGVAQ